MLLVILLYLLFVLFNLFIKGTFIVFPCGLNKIETTLPLSITSKRITNLIEQKPDYATENKLKLLNFYSFLLVIKYATAIFGIQHNQATTRYATKKSSINIIKIGSQSLNVTAAKQAA